MSLGLVALDFLFHHVDHRVDRLVGHWVLLLADVLRVYFVKHLGYQELRFLVLLLLLLLRLLVCGFVLFLTVLLLHVLELVGERLHPLLLLLLTGFALLLLRAILAFGLPLALRNLLFGVHLLAL